MREVVSISKEKLIIYVISDSLGETAEFVTRAAISQFNGGRAEFRRIPYVNDKESLLDVIEEASQYNSLIAYTLVIKELREIIEIEAAQRNLLTIDILGPMLKTIGSIIGLEPRGEAGSLHKLDEEYFRKVEAVEFAVKYDDGKDPRGIIYADIVLIGVSRTSKTPLCMYLAHKRLKAANVPLVPEVNPPDELFNLPHNKIVGLTIKPHILNEIRQERLRALGLVSSAEYASMERILRELEYAERLMKRLGCPIIDVSNKAVEETAGKILQLYYRGDRNVK